MSFVPVTVENLDTYVDILLRWRNDPDTQRASRRSRLFGREEYREEFANALSLGSEISLFYENGSDLPVGFVKLDPDHVDCCRKQLSWTVAPEARGRGVGTRMLVSAIRVFGCDRSQKLRAEIKASNTSSLKLAERAGFLKERESEDGMTHWIYDPAPAH